MERKRDRDELHPRNRHNGQYDFDALIEVCPELEAFVAPNRYGVRSVDFFNPQAVKTLNTALLFCYYGLTKWELPSGSLCPPIPGRADYIHYIAELLTTRQAVSAVDRQLAEVDSSERLSRPVRCLDIGVGANCIFPILGVAEYGWHFVGTDINPNSLDNAARIIAQNPTLSTHVELRLQSGQGIFDGVIHPDDYFDLTLCNPPFHDSPQSAQKGALRKLSNLKGRPIKRASLNFGGDACELWCEGGEVAFVRAMIEQSRTYRTQCGWFTTLVSKEEHLIPLRAALHAARVTQQRVISMHQGNKISRILAWRY